MADKNIEGANSSHLVSSTESFESSVGPKKIEGIDEDGHNDLQKTVSANFVASMQQEDPMSLVLTENKSNLQEISVEQNIPTSVSINLSPKLDGHELPCRPVEVHDGISSSSSKANEPMEAQDDSNPMKSSTASCMFEVSMQQECPVSLKLTDKKGDLQGISVKPNVPFGDYVALSPKADSSELILTNEVPDGFLTSSSKAYEPKDAQDYSITMEASEVNACAASDSMLRLSEGVQNDASCIDSGKVTCATPPAILKRVKEDKPLAACRFHKHQMSQGDTRPKVPAPVIRSSTSKYLRMNKITVDTTAPIESVKAAASKFGGSISWKTRRTKTSQETDHIIHELDKLKNEISVCKRHAEAEEAAKLKVFSELERTKEVVNEMKHALERKLAEEVDAKEYLNLFQFILQEMEEGVCCDDSVQAGEKLNNIQEQHKTLVAKVMSVKDELRKVQEDYGPLLIETDISIRKAQAAFTMSKDAEKEVEELTIELQRLKDVFDLASATCQAFEESKKNTLMARDEDCLAWKKDLRQSDRELNQISMDLSSFQELQSKYDMASIVLLNLKNELAAYLDAKLIEEAREQESGTHTPMQEEIIIMLNNELKEHRKSVAAVTDELCDLKATSASLKSQLNNEKAALAVTQRREAMASITIQSLKMEIKLSQQEFEAINAKAQEGRDRMAKLYKVLQDATQEPDEAKSVAAKAHEELRKTKEEVQRAKAALSNVQFKLESVVRDIQAAKESEGLALNTLRALEDSKVAGTVSQQCSSQTITLDLDDYTSLVQKSRQAEHLVHEKTASAIAQVEAAKESESHTLSRLNELVKALEEQKQALVAATEQADRATEGKLAMEQELRKWREESVKRRRKAGEASKPEAKPSNAAEIVGGDTKCTSKSKEDSCAAASSVHPVADASGRSSPSDLALQAKTKKAKKLSFFPRVIMFLGRRRLKAAK